MSDVLKMTASKLGDPVVEFVFMKSYNGLSHRCLSINCHGSDYYGFAHSISHRRFLLATLSANNGFSVARLNPFIRPFPRGLVEPALSH